MRFVPVVLLSLGLTMSCGPEGGGSAEDAGTAQDAGTGHDSGIPVDAGTGHDSGTAQDAGTGHDAGTVQDAGTSHDAGTTQDAGTTSDAGTSQDAGTTQDAGTSQDAGTVDTPCGIPYLGDLNAPLDFTPTALGPGGLGPDRKSGPLTQGGTISIIEPFQGGRVLFVGVRDVINMDPCSATLTGVLRDPVSRTPTIDERTITLKRSPDGRGYTPDADDASFSNVTLCPNNWSSQDLFDQDYDLFVILKDRRGKVLQKALTVRPACNVPGEEEVCRCICKKGYVLGSPCQ